MGGIFSLEKPVDPSIKEGLHNISSRLAVLQQQLIVMQRNLRAREQLTANIQALVTRRVQTILPTSHSDIALTTDTGLNWLIVKASVGKPELNAGQYAKIAWDIKGSQIHQGALHLPLTSQTLETLQADRQLALTPRRTTRPTPTPSAARTPPQQHRHGKP